MKLRKKYPLNQSPFYKLSNHQVLAKILGINMPILKKLLVQSDKNFMFGKAPGSTREIQVPKSQLFRVHLRIAKLLSRIHTPDYLSSGVKGRSHVTNAKMHCGDLEVAKVDIEKFYPSTTIEIVRKGLRKKFKMSDDVAETLSKLVTVSGFVPTGSPVSQSLAYFVNASIFDHINIYAKTRGLKFSLYVDDLTFSGAKIPKELFGFLKKHIKDNRGYNLHKFRLYGVETEKVITGVVIKKDIISVKRTHRFEISKLMNKLSYFSVKSRANEEGTISYFQKYIGHLFAAGQISPRYRQLGKKANLIRKQLNIPAKNQHTISPKKKMV